MDGFKDSKIAQLFANALDGASESTCLMEIFPGLLVQSIAGDNPIFKGRIPDDQFVLQYHGFGYPGYSLYGRMKNLAEIRGLEMGIRSTLTEPLNENNSDKA